VVCPMTRHALSALLCIAALATTPAAIAGEADPAGRSGEQEAAAAAYKKGVGYFKEKRFSDAIREFNKAYRLDPNAVLVFNMARAFEELKEYASAIEFYRKYLEMAPDAQDRASVEESIRTLELLAKPVKTPLTITSEPDGATVFFDGREVGKTPLKMAVPAGKHFIALEKAGYERASSELELAGEAAQSHAVTLLPGGAPPPPPPAEKSDTWAWVAVGVGAALLAGSGLAGIQALKKSDRLDEIDDDPTLADGQEYDQLKSDGRTFALVADGLLIAGIAGVATGTVLFFSGGDAAEKPKSAPAGEGGGAAALGLTLPF